MNTNTIEMHLKKFPEFLGAFPADIHCLPEILNYPSGLVVNSDSCEFPGAHWVSIYFKNKNTCYFFDSYGLPPILKSHRDYIYKYSKYIDYNCLSVQGPLSVTCGGHSIFFLTKIFEGYSMDSTMKFYSNDILKNDSMIYKMYF